MTSFPNLGHYDFARSECVGNNRSSDEGHDQLDVTADFDTIVTLTSSAVGLSRWMGATEKALSFSDNERLKPGHNDSKPYPGDIHVQYAKIPMPDTSPQVTPHVCLWKVVVAIQVVTRLNGGIFVGDRGTGMCSHPPKSKEAMCTILVQQ